MKKALKNKINAYEKNPEKFDVYSYDEAEKKKLLEYMRSFEPSAVAGLVYDFVTKTQMKQENLGYTDDEFSWSSSDIYHIEKYNAAVSEEFIKKINN